MRTNGWDLIFTDYFLEQVALIQEYVARFSEKRGRKLTSDLMPFVTDRIPLNPYAFMEYRVMKTTNSLYRKAIFRHTYVVIYRIDGNALVF